MANTTERLANIGYIGLKVEATPGVAVVPTDFIPLYSEDMSTMLNLVEDVPIAGMAWGRYQNLQGQRGHKGKFTCMAEPNTAAKLFNMLMTAGTILTGYTITCTSANATIGATYTNNGQTFTVVGTIAASTTLLVVGTGAPAASGTLTKATGTGDATITFSAFSANNINMWPFTTGVGAASYTVDISTGNQVFRFFGSGLSQISPKFQGNEMQFECNMSSLGAWDTRQLASTPTGTNPWTIVFDTTYDPAPTDGLVVGDTLQIQKAAGGTINIVVASINVNGTTITTTTADPTSAVLGDAVIIRPQTPSFTSRTPFLWSRSQFCFSTTALLALSATHTPLEQGVDWAVMHKFENDEGSKRSGNFDPASLPRLTYDASFKIKKFFDDPLDMAKFNSLVKQAVVIRHFSETNFELRITMNNIKPRTTPKPKLSSDALAYAEFEFAPQYDPTDGQAMDVKVLDALAAL